MTRLFVSDLDGTLLDGKGRMSEFTRRELSRLLDDGLAFTVASARSVVSMQKILDGLPLRLPIVEFNGAFISDLRTGDHEICNAMDRDIAEAVVAEALARDTAPFVSTFDGEDDRLHYTGAFNEGMECYLNDRIAAGDRRLRRVDDLSAGLCEQVVCLTLIARREALAPIAEWIDERFDERVRILLQENIYNPGWHWLTVFDRRATKASAIRELADAHGFDIAETTVFGDQVNDIPMFEAAGHAVAVSNADDELKRHANEVIGPNDEDSVVRYLQREFSS